MRILALETTERRGSVAAMDTLELLAERSLAEEVRTAQSLVPAMQDLLAAVGWRPGDVQLAAVSRGPGSFTGLRIGITTAKVFAYAVGAEVLGVDTLEVIAAAAPADVEELLAVMDAQRGQVVARRFSRQAEGSFAPVGPQQLVDVEAWMNDLPAGITVSGPVLTRLRDRLPSHVRVLEPSFWPPRASVVARLAARDYALGRRDDLWTLSPHYFRRSAAEEKWDARH